MIRLRREITTKRRRMLIGSVIAVLALVLLAEHSGPNGHEMDSAMSMAGICLAIVDLAIVGGAGVPNLPSRTRLRARFRLTSPHATLLAPLLALPARAGPAQLQVVLR